MQLTNKEADSKLQATAEDQRHEEIAQGGAGTFDQATSTSEEITIKGGV